MLRLVSSLLTPKSRVSSLLHASGMLIEFADNRKLERKILQLKIQEQFKVILTVSNAG